MWYLAARNVYSLLGTQELGKPSILDCISQHKAAFKMSLPFQRGKKLLKGFKFRENSVSHYLGFISSQVLTLFSFSNKGVLGRKNPK